MNTSRPQSTISYNTERFLKKTLNDLINDGTISFWFYIKHKPDSDDKVEHIHLRIELRKKIDTIEFASNFIQHIRDKKHPITKTRSFQYSDCNNWFCYVVHNLDYLAYKNMTRNIQYTLLDIKSNDKEECEYRYKIAMEWLYSELLKDYYAENKLREGISLQCLADSGVITSRNAFRMKQFKDLLTDSKVDRAYKDCINLQNELNQALDSIHAQRDELKLQIANYERLNKELRQTKQQLVFHLENPFESG